MKFDDERMKYLYPYIKDKEVLDIGCFSEVANSFEDSYMMKGWIHGFLNKYSRKVIGIDIIKENIELLKKKGYDVYCKSADDFTFNRKFDVIFAGDVIEHLSNPGMFLDKSREHIKEDGYLIVTTPNVFCLTYKIGGILRLKNNNLSVNPEHTVFFSPSVLNTLMERHKFKIEKIIFVNFHRIDNFKRYIQDVLCKIFGDSLRYNMMVFARPI